MIYADICSGISAATMAWHPLGWRAAFYAEIEKFPSAVLAHRYPDTPNLGDIALYEEWPDAALDVLVAGTPCQGFSVAGKRAGLDDPRSNLALCFGRIAQRYRPVWIVWENVPGVRSANKGRDFGAFIEGLAELGYGLCWRSLDAQFAGLAQRRQRLFLVGYLGDWRPAAAVLLEPEGLRWDPAPSREAGEGVAAPIRGCSNGGGANGPGRTADDAGSLIPSVANPLTARMHKGVNTTMDEGQTMVVGFSSSKDHGADAGDLSPTLRAMGYDASHANGGGQVAVAFQPRFARNDRGGPQEELAWPLTAEAGRTGKGDSAQCVALADPISAHEGRTYSHEGKNNFRLHNVVQQAWAVRRLTPRECERLMGFSDDFTRIAWRGKPAERCPDGPRYKALGNSIAVPELRWIGSRIMLCEEAMRMLGRIAA